MHDSILTKRPQTGRLEVARAGAGAGRAWLPGASLCRDDKGPGLDTAVTMYNTVDVLKPFNHTRQG